MESIFVSITERMKHFYSILNSDGSGAPVAGASSRATAQKIIDNLKATAEKLVTKKRKIISSGSKSKSSI